ncbi:hypothetical protein B566_EDAN015407 [Ephemera danica]|nr:hypothetical protein B566_EDAN015407 [Ephemera danica]
MFRRIFPLISRGAKAVGKEALSTGVNLLKDALNGINKRKYVRSSPSSSNQSHEQKSSHNLIHCWKWVLTRNMNHYAAYFEYLFNFNSTAKESHQTAPLLYTDEPGKLDDNAGKIIDLAGKLHCDLFNTSKYVLNEIEIRFIFERIYCGISKIKKSRRIPLDSEGLNQFSILLAHANNLNHHTAKYLFKRKEMHINTFSSGSKYHTVEKMFLGRIPIRVIIGLVYYKAFSAVFGKCAYNFQHFDQNYLTLYKNGEQMISRPYVTIFDDS